MRKTVDNLKLLCNNYKGNNRKLVREKVCKQQHLLEHFGTEDHSDFYMAWKFFLLIGQTLRTLGNGNVEKQPPEVFCKKDVLKNLTKFTRKHRGQSLFFNKFAGLWNLSTLIWLMVGVFLPTCWCSHNNSETVKVVILAFCSIQ